MFWLGAIVSLCYVPGITGAFIATQWPVLSILLPFALWRSGPVTRFHWLGLLFLAYAFAHLYSVPVADDGIWGVWLLSISALSFWLGSTLDDLRGLYKGLAIGGAVSSVVAVVQACGYTGAPYYINAHPAGLYVNGVVQGTLLALIIVALVSERLWLWVPMLLPGLLLSGSRGALLALAVGIGAVYFRRMWLFAALGLAGARFLFNVQPDSSDELRLLIWNDALHFLTPWGWGPGSFFSWLIPYRDTLIHPEYAHNDAIQLIFEYGVGAALPFVIFAFAATRTKDREWPVLVAFVVAGCYSMPLWIPIASFLGCVAAGRIVRNWALARDYGHRRGQAVVAWRDRLRGKAVSVVSTA